MSVFDEHLNYFFVGRPAYKTEIDAEAKYWELPCCFILDLPVSRAKRIYPFDTGGYLSNPPRYPRFITMIDLDEFLVKDDPRAIDKLIGSFFTSRARYFLMDPRNETDFQRRFNVQITDEEITALYELIKAKRGAGDDRRLSLEVQFDHAVELSDRNVLAVVIPEVYLESAIIMETIEIDLKAEAIPYPIWPIKKEFHYHAIYTAVHEFYKDKGLV